MPEDFVPTRLAQGPYGPVMLAGNRGDRAALVYTWPAVGAPHVVDLPDGPLLGVAQWEDTIVVTGTGKRYWVDPPDEFGRHAGRVVSEEALPRSDDDQPAVAAWVTNGEGDLFTVLAFPVEGGHELVISDFQNSGPLVSTSNRLFATGDLSAVRVTSAQGLLLVSGPVSDDIEQSRGCQVWLADDPLFGEGGWTQEFPAPQPLAITDHRESWWWAGHDGSTLQVWYQDTAVIAPRIEVENGRLDVLLADEPFYEKLPVLATQGASGSRLHWTHFGHWQTAELPLGKLRAALRTDRHSDPNMGSVPHRVHVIVDDTAWWMDWDDVRKAGRATDTSAGTPPK